MHVNETRVRQKGGYLPGSAGKLLPLHMLLAKKTPVKNCCGDTQNCGRRHLYYTQPCGFLISWVSKAILHGRCATPKEMSLNCTRLHQDRILLPTMLPSSCQFDTYWKGTEVTRWLLLPRVWAGQLRTVL